VISAGQDGFLRWWTEELILRREICLPHSPVSLGWLHDSELLVVGDEWGGVSVFRLVVKK
jgi:hypothetical protein